MSDELLRAQVDAIIRDEIQDVINNYVDDKEKVVTPEGFSGFVTKEDKEKELKVNVPKDEVDKLIKEYKKLKRKSKSNFSQIKKLGLVDKNGRPL
tara:strand:+ start:816 stop:1100 length:285 start_codon:yes stop_codon:yes gene_type:complete